MASSTVTDGSLSPPLDGDFEFEFPQGIDHDDDEPQEPLNYNEFPNGFSDDEGDDGLTALVAAAQAGKPRRRSKKSPRRTFESDSNSESEPSSKRARKSLFGGENSPQQQENDIQDRFSSINLDGEDHAVQNAQVQDYGFQPLTPPAAVSRASPTPSEERDSTFVRENPLNAYNLRTKRPTLNTTYMDQDDSGNFDPALEAKQKFVRQQHKKDDQATKRKQKKGGKGKAAAAKPCQCGEGKFLVRLQIDNRAQLCINTDNEESCPSGYQPPCADCEAVQNANRQPKLVQSGIYQIPIEDPAEELPDLTGHPEARGCKLCRRDGKMCTLVGGDDYPCQTCDDQGETCELMIPADDKGRCKQCRDNEVEECSFETDPDQAICDTCAKEDLECDALPPEGYKAARISIDEIMYGPDRPMTKCANCFVNNRKCTLKSKSDEPPCKACAKANIGCIFKDEKSLKLMQKKRAAIRNQAVFTNGQSYVPEVSIPSATDLFTAEELAEIMASDDEKFVRPPTPEIELEDGNGNKGLTMTISTSFAHPIQFCSLLTEAVAVDCNFCQSPGFSFIGHGQREVWVIEWRNGLGFSELGGGHVEHEGPSVMCRDCVLVRAQILNCEDHEIAAICKNDMDLDFDELTARMIEAGGGEARREEMEKWCSFCFMSAEFLCCALQPALLPSGGEDEEIHGCGLRLCTSCESALGSEKMGGDVGKMAADRDLLPKALDGEEDLAGKVRADVGFLSEEGLLMKNVIHEMANV